MPSYASIDDRRQRSPIRVGSNGLVRLGLPHFALLVGILGGILALTVLVLYTFLASP